MSEVAHTVLQTLEKYSTFPLSIFRAQCSAAGIEPRSLQEDDLERLVPLLEQAVARFTTAEKGRMLRRDILSGFGLQPTDSGLDVQPRRPKSGYATASHAFAPESQLEPFAQRVFDILKEATPLAWAVLKSHCELEGIDPATISQSELGALIPSLAKSVSRFTSPQKGELVRKRLRSLR